MGETAGAAAAAPGLLARQRGRRALELTLASDAHHCVMLDRNLPFPEPQQITC